MYRLTRLAAWCVYSMRYPAYKPVGSFFRRPYGTKQEIPIRYSVQNTVAVRRNPAPSNCQNPRAPPRRPRPAAAGSPVPPALPCQAPSLPRHGSRCTTPPPNRPTVDRISLALALHLVQRPPSRPTAPFPTSGSPGCPVPFPWISSWLPLLRSWNPQQQEHCESLWVMAAVDVRHLSTSSFSFQFSLCYLIVYMVYDV